MITVHSHITSLHRFQSGFDNYLLLAEQFGQNDCFLLESLAGPEADTNRALVGFKPLLSVALKQDQLTLCGHSAVLTPICQALATSTLVHPHSAHQFHLPDLKDLWHVLRLIEAQFIIQRDAAPVQLRFGFFGYFGYDVIHCVEDIPRQIADDKPLADMVMNIYQGLVYCDLKQQKTYLIHNDIDGVEPLKADTLSTLLDVQQSPSEALSQQTTPAPQQIEDSVDKATYFDWVARALHHISIGDIYQIQLGHELTIKSQITPFAVYQRLREFNPSPYMYLAHFNGMDVIGASPELFISIQNGYVTQRPIAGTIKRGKDDAEDRQLSETLCNDEKERAEHLMLVDLARNDIGRICQKNTLKVQELMIVERYSHVLHLVSTVSGQKRDELDHYDVIATNFPAGTMTGTPKIRAVELIEAIENCRRGLYAGCIGFIDFSGAVETALCIRTAFYDHGTYTIRASGGVVADSTQQGEWQETISKLSAPYLAITGRELRNEDFIN